MTIGAMSDPSWISALSRKKRTCLAFVCAALTTALFQASLEAQGSIPGLAIPTNVQAEIRNRVDNRYAVAIVAGVLNSNGVSFYSYGSPGH